MSHPIPVVVAEDQDCWAVCKPAGWLSIPGRMSAPVLSEWVEKELGKPWVVHRLDLETSGVILFAKNAEAHRQMNDWFLNRKVKKSYLCLTEKRQMLPSFLVKVPVAGAPATTLFKVEEKFDEALLIRAQPETGRRHQIRVHLKEQGIPILGDRRYGGKTLVETPSGQLSLDRVALHAEFIDLPGGRRFTCEAPSDFSGWLEQLRSCNLKT